MSRFRGRETSLVYRLVALTGDHVRFEGDGRGATAYDDFTLTTTASGGTRIDYAAGVDLKGWRSLADPFLRGLYATMGRGAVHGLTTALS